MATSYRVMAEDLAAYCEKIFVAMGEGAENAKSVTQSLIDAELRNVASHGVVRVANYTSRLKNKGSAINPVIKHLSEAASAVNIDGGNGLGAIASEYAVTVARNKAKETAVGIVTVCNSNHYGTAAYWAMKLAGDDMVGLSCSNVEPLICVTGGASKGIGNNPIACASPTRSFGHICYDVACSMMAGGKLFEYQMAGKQLPEGCFLDSSGKPTTDPFAAHLMRPFGGHKGYGLAVMVEMLTSVLSGSKFGDGMGSQYGILDKPNYISHFFLAIRIDALRNLDEYLDDADGFVTYLHSLPKSEGTESIYYPGELEHLSKAAKLKEGILLREQLVDELVGIGREHGVPESCEAFFKRVPIAVAEETAAQPAPRKQSGLFK